MLSSSKCTHTLSFNDGVKCTLLQVDLAAWQEDDCHSSVMTADSTRPSGTRTPSELSSLTDAAARPIHQDAVDYPAWEPVTGLMSYAADLSHSPTLVPADVNVLRVGPHLRPSEHFASGSSAQILVDPHSSRNLDHRHFEYDAILFYRAALLDKASSGLESCIFPIFPRAEDESGRLVLLGVHLRHEGGQATRTHLGMPLQRLLDQVYG